MEAVLGQDVADARRRFDEVCDRLRPDLHRFCTRMTGSPCDGEDVLQDALVLAFYRFPELRDDGAFRAWVFRIAHNKCIDFLRGQRHFEALDLLDPQHGLEEDRTMDDELDHRQRAGQALAHIVTALPPKERACVILKDVLEWSLEETAAATGASIGAVKAALHRGRSKLQDAERDGGPDVPVLARTTALEPRDRALVERYLAAFNRRDWDGVLAMLSDEARLEVVHRSEGPFRHSCYFTNYGRLPWRWKLALVRVDGVESIVHLREVDGAWQPHAIVQLAIAGDAITLVRDYVHVDYLLDHCVVALEASEGRR
jgi:RNA polymerase sigma-70 factor (ECF subfamily)